MQLRFYSKPVQNPVKTAASGRPIFDEIEMCEIMTADKNFQPHFRAHEPTVTYDNKRQAEDRRTWAERYPEAYQAFKQAMNPSESGTPVEQWPILSRAKVSELRAIGLMTVEQVAAMDHATTQMLGPEGKALAAQATAYIEQARSSAPSQRMAAENEALKREIERLKADLAMTPIADPNGDEFDAMAASDLKAFIRDKTGETPKGNPSLNTLRDQAREVAE